LYDPQETKQPDHDRHDSADQQPNRLVGRQTGEKADTSELNDSEAETP
jgi:hypothetical protein